MPGPLCAMPCAAALGAALIDGDDSWAVWMVLLPLASICILLEQRTRWGGRLTGPVLAVVAGMILSNSGVLPTSAPAYDVVWDYLLPLVVPLLIMRIDLRRILRESGRLFLAFHVSALGTIAGAFLAVALLHTIMPETGKMAGVMTASYIGGGVNFFAMVAEFRPDPQLANAAIVADNLVMLLSFLVVLAMPALTFFARHYRRLPAAPGDGAGPAAASFWQPKRISLADIAICLAAAMLIAGLSVEFSEWIKASALPGWLKGILGPRYLVLTTFSLLFALAAAPWMRRVQGNDEIGTYLIYIFFVLIGIPADILQVFAQSPVLFLFCGIKAGANLLVTFTLGRLLGLRLEELILAAVTTLGGPMNGAAIAIAKGWRPLVMPAFLVGVWGYVIGNYCGYAVGKVLIHLFGQ